MKNKRKIFIIVFICSIVLILLSWSIIKLLPIIKSIYDENTLLEFKENIQSLGFLGVLCMLGIQILQVFIAFIPGEIVELLAGLLYGTWGGLMICLIGNFIGSFLIYLIVRLFAKKLIIKYQDKLTTYRFLNNKKKIALYLFIIYLIPGIPKDIITYLIPFLPIDFLTFILITSIARIPSIISSTYSSTSFLEQNYTIAIIILSIFSALTIIGFIYRDKIITLFNNDKQKENTDNTSK